MQNPHPLKNPGQDSVTPSAPSASRGVTDRPVNGRPTLRVTEKLDFPKEWNELKGHVREILREPMKPLKISLSKLNIRVYKLTVSNTNEDVASQIHTELTELFGTHLKELSGPESTEQLVDWYEREWIRFEQALRILSSIFSYLHTSWRVDNKQTHHTRQIGLAMWREHIYAKRTQSLVGAMLSIIAAEREAGTVSPRLTQVGNILNSLTHLSPNIRRPHHFFKNDFEGKFLDASRKVFAKEAQKLHANAAAEGLEFDVAFLKKLSNFVDEEDRRSDRYLDPHLTTKADVRLAALNELVDARFMEQCREPFKQWLMSDNIDVHRSRLEHVFSLVSQTKKEERITELLRAFEEVVRKYGTERIGTNRDQFAHNCAEVYKRFFHIVQRCFQRNNRMLKALRDGAEAFINKQNAIVKADVDPPAVAANLVAHFAHTVLSGGKTTTSTDIESGTQDAITLVGLLEDKEQFRGAHSEFLAKRIMMDAGYDRDREASFAGQLRLQSGQDFTYKWERMLNDAELKKESKAAFREYLANNVALDQATKTALLEKGPKEFSALVLAHGSWPSFVKPEMVIRCPEIDRICEHFASFYQIRHRRKCVQWVHPHDVGVLCTQFAKHGDRNPYEITVNFNQAAILLQFTTAADVLSSEALLSELGMDETTLGDALKALKGLRLVQCDQQGESGPIRAVRLNLAFKNSKKTLSAVGAIGSNENTTSSGKSTGDTQQPAATLGVDPEKKLVVQAAIMRVMKARKRCSYRDLNEEVVIQLSNRFKPKPEVLKAMIDVLLEKEYLERDETDRDYLIYVAA